jgi:aminoglycoside 6'-N-acetyltransferase I
MSEISIRRATCEDIPEWLRMRHTLWSTSPLEDLRWGLEEVLADPRQAVFLAVRADGNPCGFLETRTRDYGEGCETSPVGYIEGWYVDEDVRNQGIGRRLVQAAEDWARSLGLTEMCSDTWLDNESSIQAHLKLGYEETDRLVHFAKKL